MVTYNGDNLIPNQYFITFPRIGKVINIDAVFLALARFASDGAKSVVGRRLLGNRRELAESISSRLMAYDCEMHTSIGYGRIVADLLLGPSTKREAIRGTNGE